ncbi:hypothetical protein [Halorubrum sp. CBA1229]|jgi:hypothetical protein|uniref:hypothetical protein n=1 Tax=Halorubrum sp. CBA1229 TaxID=1853699 RepID=UPI0013159083|nr:hypothetical protein [Halorubrum sp. CBA1229]QKY16389.1 hypothetical protein Hrr1229_005670 [Halorubrum sp. CBA1229]
MSRSATVKLRSDRGTHTEDVEADVTATDAALVDMARRQAGISGTEFKTGEVVA